MADETVNELLRDALVGHHVDIQRLNANQRADLAETLYKTEGALRKQIADALADLATEGTPVDLSTQAALRQLRLLEQSVGTMRSSALDDSFDTLEDQIGKAMTFSSSFASNLLKVAAPVVWDTTLPSPQLLKSLIGETPVQGKLLSEWADRFKDEDLNRVMDAVKTGLTLGESNVSIAKRVAGSAELLGKDGVTQVTRNQLDALSRTSTNFYTNGARQIAFAENGVNFELYVATLDSRTTPECASLDGQVFAIGEGPLPPIHWNCRSTRVPVLDPEAMGNRPAKSAVEKDLVAEFRERDGVPDFEGSTRDSIPRGFKGEYDAFAAKRIRELTGPVPGATTYSEWFAKQSPAFQEEVLGVTKARLYREGGLSLDKFVHRPGDSVTLKDLVVKHREAFVKAGLDPLDFAKTAAQAADDAVKNVLLPKIGQRVEELLKVGLGNQEVADAILREFPGAETTAKSVASVKAGLKKQGVEFEPKGSVIVPNSAGSAQAVADFEASVKDLPLPTNWKAADALASPGAYSSYIPGQGVAFNEQAMKAIARPQAQQVVAHEVGHFLDKAQGIKLADLKGLKQRAAEMAGADRKAYAYYLSHVDELVAEVYAQAMSPSVLTSQGLSATNFNLHFAKQIGEARLLLKEANIKPSLALPAPAKATPKIAAVPPKPSPAVEAKPAGAATPVKAQKLLTPDELDAVPAVKSAKQSLAEKLALKEGLEGWPQVEAFWKGKGRPYWLSKSANWPPVTDAEKIAIVQLNKDKAVAAAQNLVEAQLRLNKPTYLPSTEVRLDYVAPSMERTQEALKFLGQSSSTNLTGFGLTVDEYAAVRGYSGSYYSKFNQPLRRETLTLSQREQYLAATSALDDAIAKLPKFRGITVRNIRVDAKDYTNLLSTYRVGGTIVDPGYVSTTKNRGGVFSGAVRLVIEGKSGVDISSMSLHRGEQEVLFGRNTRFRVDKVTKSSQGYEIILTEV